MDKGFWDRVQELKESINGGVEPMDDVKLPTRIVKIGLGMYLVQSIIITLWWSIKDSVFYPWLFFISTFLQIGWYWNKVTDSWKAARGFRYVQVNTDHNLDDSIDTSIYNPPSINVQNDGITTTTDHTVNIDASVTNLQYTNETMPDPLLHPSLWGEQDE